MGATRWTLIVAAALCVAAAWGQPNRGDPHLGYVYPAGGQAGSTFRVTAGGQALRGASDIHVRGEGVQASVVEYVRPLSNKQLGDVAKHLRELTKQRVAEMQAKRNGAPPPQPAPPAAGQEELPALPDHPLLRGLEQKSLKELMGLRALLFDPKKQPNAQIAEQVLIDVTINPGAAPGDRELRTVTPAGLTNPMLFEVGALPEVSEQEPNNSGATSGPRLDLPVLLNGQIMPGDVDRFRFQAAQGQQLVIRTEARRLVPYLADAVPGWFQPTITLYDARGREVAFADDYRFDPDPVLLYAIPADGEYGLEVRDAIYRGREDFVYRISVGELPIITGLFPLGGQAGVVTVASLEGWNLPEKQLPLDTQPGAERIRRTVLAPVASLCNPVEYAVDDLPECEETEPNDAAANPQRIELPRIVNGRVAKPGDVDRFQFKGRAGEDLVADVCARRLRSPLDSLLRLTDASGKVLAWNDDHEDKAMGLLTHHADSYLTARLPKDGTYQVQVCDAEEHGGEAYAYRLRLSAPRPGLALRVTPSSINVAAGRAAPICVYALREDGFAGDIEAALKNPPAGFAVTGGRILAGRDCTHMTLSAPQAWIKAPFVLELEGRAVIDGQTVSRPVVPAEDMMQAFAYRHLVPSQQLMAKVTPSPAYLPTLSLAGGAVTIPAGGTAQVHITTAALPALADIQLALREPPAGISVRQVDRVPGGLRLVLQANAAAAQVGPAGNLIVEAHANVERRRPDGQGTGQRLRVPLGVLPAIACEIVKG